MAGRYAVARLAPETGWPWWATWSRMASVTRTPTETSVVCEEGMVPLHVRAERDFVAWTVEGTLDFSAVGIIASLTTALADRGVSCLAVSTHDSDLLLVRSADEPAAMTAWSAAGWTVREEPVS